MNTQLLEALEAQADDPLARAASAFESMAPWLKAYSVYCASFVTAQERLEWAEWRLEPSDDSNREHPRHAPLTRSAGCVGTAS